MTRTTINPQLLKGVKANTFITYKNLELRPRLLPECLVTFVFSTGLPYTIDAARLRENSAFINACIEKPCFEARGSQIWMANITESQFSKYLKWVQYLKISRKNLEKAPEGLRSPALKAYFRENTQCVTMERIVQWWLLGEVMQDKGLMACAKNLLNHYALTEKYELPVQMFELGWKKSKQGSELRAWIFTMLTETLTMAVLQERGEQMPQDLLCKLFMWFVEDYAAGTLHGSAPLAAWRESEDAASAE